MPISNNTVVTLGNGDVGIGAGTVKNKRTTELCPTLSFTEIEPVEIGTNVLPENADERKNMHHDIFIIFANRESFEILKRAVNAIENFYNKGEIKE